MDHLKKQVRAAQGLFIKMIPVINAETNDLTAEEAVAWWAGFTSAMALTVIAEAAEGAANKCMAADYFISKPCYVQKERE